jgi:hypothetical protein
VDETECVFYAEGERAEVLEFIGLVAAALSALSTENLEVERRVLRAEAAQREQGIASRLLQQRFGLAGYGLGGQVSWGCAGSARTSCAHGARRTSRAPTPASG